MVTTLNGYEDALRPNLPFNDDVNFPKALGQAITHHLRFADLCAFREIETYEVDQTLKIVRSLRHVAEFWRALKVFARTQGSV